MKSRKSIYERAKLKTKPTRFQIRKTYLGVILLIISVGLIMAGGFYYLSVYGG